MEFLFNNAIECETKPIKFVDCYEFITMLKEPCLIDFDWFSYPNSVIRYNGEYYGYIYKQRKDDPSVAYEIMKTMKMLKDIEIKI